MLELHFYFSLSKVIKSLKVLKFKGLKFDKTVGGTQFGFQLCLKDNTEHKKNLPQQKV